MAAGKTGKMSRRQLMIVLGSGAIAGASVAASGIGQASKTGAQKKPLPTPTPKMAGPCPDIGTVPDVVKAKGVMSITTCCEPPKKLLTKKGTLTKTETTHISKLVTALNEEPILQYCVMVWGLNATEAKAFDLQINKTVQERK